MGHQTGRSQTAIYLFIWPWCLWAFSLKRHWPDTALETIKRESLIIGPELGSALSEAWKKEINWNTNTCSCLLLSLIYGTSRQGLVQNHCPWLQVHILAVEKHWHSCRWCLQRLGLHCELVVSGEAAGRCSALTEGVGSSSSLQPRAGLSLGVFWAASSLWCSDQLWMRAAAICLSVGTSTHLQLWQWPCEGFFQKYIHSSINCISLICWVHGTDALSKVSRFQRGITSELCSSIVVPGGSSCAGEAFSGSPASLHVCGSSAGYGRSGEELLNLFGGRWWLCTSVKDQLLSQKHRMHDGRKGCGYMTDLIGILKVIWMISVGNVQQYFSAICWSWSSFLDFNITLL